MCIRDRSSSGVVNFRTGAELASDIGAGTGTVTGSGTATRVAFWNSSTALSSSADLYWDAENSRLGVGTDSPSAELDVSGTFQATSVLLKLNGTSTSKKYLQINGNGGSGSVSGQSGVGFRPINAGNNVHASIEGLENGNGSYQTNMTFNTNGSNSDSAPTERMRIQAAGNVGIGTTSPSDKLQVNGTVRASGYKSSDGSAGITTTVGVKNASQSQNLTLTIKDGVVTAVSGQNFQIKCYVAHNGILIGDRVTAVAYGNEFAKGTGSFTESLNPSYATFNNSPIILKDMFLILAGLINVFTEPKNSHSNSC